MKKAISVLLLIALVLSMATLTGCGRKRYALKPYATVRYAPKTVSAEGAVFTAADQSWTCTIHVNDAAAQQSTDRLMYRAVAIGMEQARFLNREIGGKQIGAFTYQTATYTEKGKFGGRYYCAFSPALAVRGSDDLVYDLYVEFSADNDAALPAIEELLATLKLKTR